MVENIILFQVVKKIFLRKKYFFFAEHIQISEKTVIVVKSSIRKCGE